jgi:hypothetical protein
MHVCVVEISDPPVCRLSYFMNNKLLWGCVCCLMSEYTVNMRRIYVGIVLGSNCSCSKCLQSGLEHPQNWGIHKVLISAQRIQHRLQYNMANEGTGARVATTTTIPGSAGGLQERPRTSGRHRSRTERTLRGEERADPKKRHRIPDVSPLIILPKPKSVILQHC